MQSPKALIYNDQHVRSSLPIHHIITFDFLVFRRACSRFVVHLQVLEHHSSCRGYAMLTRACLLDGLSNSERKYFRHAFCTSILATDSACPSSHAFAALANAAHPIPVSVHKRLLRDIEARVAASPIQPFTCASREHRVLFLSFVLHCAGAARLFCCQDAC